jgi:hypothetical protein
MAAPVVKAGTPVKPGEVRFDLLRDTALVRESLVGTWYQADHLRDGSSSTFALAKLFADGTARNEYWTLDHAQRIATHGTDKGVWRMRGDTIGFHFEGQPAPAEPTPGVPDGPIPPRDDEQRMLEATKDWFTYEYRPNVNPTSENPGTTLVFEGVSVRVADDSKFPRSLPGYRSQGMDIDPPAPAEKAPEPAKQ